MGMRINCLRNVTSTTIPRWQFVTGCYEWTKKSFQWWDQIRTSNNLLPRICCEIIMKILCMWHYSKLLSPVGVNVSGLPGIWFWWVGSIGHSLNRLKMKWKNVFSLEQKRKKKCMFLYLCFYAYLTCFSIFNNNNNVINKIALKSEATKSQSGF